MRNGRKGLCCAVLALSFAISQFEVRGIIAQDQLEQLEEEAVLAAVSAIAPSLIRFETIGGQSRVDEVVVSQSPSTGTVVSKDGYVVSASFHFAHRPASIFATMPDGKKAAAEIVGRDPTRKIVLLKIDTEFEFSVPQLSERSSVRVGETVIGVGRVLDAQAPNVTTGIVSATNRVWGRAIQTDAKVSPANFGGPLMRLDGKVIGILVPMSPDDDAEMAGTQWYDSGIGFAVPLNEIMERFDDLKDGKALRRGLLGISLKGADVYADPAIVAFCQGDSPAGLAGVKPDDRIVSINDIPIRRHSEVKHAVGPLYEGDTVSVKVDRAGEELEFNFELAGEIEKFVLPGIGVLASNDASGEGVVADSVFKDRPGDKAGLKAGSRLREINGERLVDVVMLREKIMQLEVGSIAGFLVADDGSEPKTIKIEVGRLTASIENVESNFGVEGTTTIEVKVPDMSNKCIAIVPDKATNGAAPGLLIWVPSPGKYKTERFEDVWSDHCQQRNMVVMIPQSTDEKKWNSDDADFIIAALESLRKTVKIRTDQIAIGGEKAGGTMAGLVAFGHRSLFRGLVLVQSGLSRRSQSVVASPIEPLMVLIGLKEAETKPISDTIKRLEKEKFPLAVEKQMGELKDSAAMILQWMSALDRL